MPRSTASARSRKDCDNSLRLTIALTFTTIGQALLAKSTPIEAQSAVPPNSVTEVEPLRLSARGRA
ncbi:MAG: hypothetical protein C4527_27435 [Candidatus Omnitrophota bacterium]|nr:MAG: hypothetical protein C4527_27435 [Candidatus Omnitrophota bacterium]